MKTLKENPDTILLREHLTPLCGWNLVKPDPNATGWWEKDNCERVIGARCPIDDTIEAADDCLPKGVHLMKMEWLINRSQPEDAAMVVFLVMYEDGSTQPLILGWSGKRNEKQARFHLAIWAHDEVAKKKN